MIVLNYGNYSSRVCVQNVIFAIISVEYSPVEEMFPSCEMRLEHYFWCVKPSSGTILLLRKRIAISPQPNICLISIVATQQSLRTLFSK